MIRKIDAPVIFIFQADITHALLLKEFFYHVSSLQKAYQCNKHKSLFYMDANST